MAEPMFAHSPDRRRKAGARFDPLSATAAVFFLLAICAAAYPAFQAFKSGEDQAPGLLLLIGLAGVAFLGLFAFATTELRETGAATADQSLAALVDALPEPAAVAGLDGRLMCANPAWRKLLGQDKRLPKSGVGGLYAALIAAKRTGSGEARFQVAGEERGVVISKLDGDRLVVEVDDPAWATQLRFLEGTMRTRLAEVAGASIERIEVRVARRR